MLGKAASLVEGVWVVFGREWLDRARSYYSTLTFVGVKVECRPHQTKLSHVPIFMKVRKGVRLGSTRLQYPPTRVGIGDWLGQASLQHLMAMVKLGDGL